MVTRPESRFGSGWVDADTHLYEPPELWQERMDRRFREDAPALVPIDDGRVFFQYAKRVYPTMPNHPGFGAIYSPGGTAIDSVCDPVKRLRWMDDNRTDIQILYPTLALNGASQVDDPVLAGALARAYNQYAAEFAATDPRRLVPAIVAPMNHPDVAIQEITFARQELGLTLAVSNPTPPGNVPWSDPRYHDVWAAAFTDDGLLPEALRFGRNVMVCTDWPHPPAEVVERRGLNHLYERSDLPSAERQALLAENARRFLGLDAVRQPN